MEKIAVVLFNLGGPDRRESIKPFLLNFFMDPNIIAAPKPIRFLIATLIANRRSRKQAGDSYARLGDKSPLLDNTRAQATALEEALGPQYRVFICMRYWHPMSDEVARSVRDYNPDRVVLLPLYPQFSTTTTWSSLGAWESACRKIGYTPDTVMTCCYPFDNGFIRASVNRIRPVYEAAVRDASLKGTAPPRLLFSAHGLPEKIIKGGDPYQWQCEQSAARIAAALEIENLDWSICYQSRVGPLKWIGPSTEEALQKAASDQVPVVIYPHAFVSEHVETLVEIEEEYRHLAETLGVPGFHRAPTVSADPDFIAGLATLVRDRLDSSPGLVASNEDRRVCPEHFDRCCMQARQRLS